MDAAAELGRNPVSKHHMQPEHGDEQADGTAEPVARGQIFRRERGQVNINFPCSADHEQDWQPYAVSPYSCYMCDHTSLFCFFTFHKTTRIRDMYSIKTFSTWSNWV